MAKKTETINNPFHEIRKQLKKDLSSSRYEHTLGVCYTCAALAMRYGENVERSMMAGLLHDCAKYMSAEDLINYCQKHELKLSSTELTNTALLHSKAGSIMAKEKYHIDDQSILNAIFTHTTGAPNMDLLGRILYIADFIEPHRKKLPNMDEVRKEAFIDLNKTIVMVIQSKLEYLKSKSDVIDEKTAETYEYYLNEIERRSNDK